MANVAKRFNRCAIGGVLLIIFGLNFLQLFNPIFVNCVEPQLLQSHSDDYYIPMSGYTTLSLSQDSIIPDSDDRIKPGHTIMMNLSHSFRDMVRPKGIVIDVIAKEGCAIM